MTFDFTVKEFILGGGTGTPTFQFYRRGFNLGGSATPSWQDVIISGTTALTLVNAKANGLNYLHIMGNCSQASTPTPSSPVDIKCNNGTIKVKDDELPVGYRRIESIKGDGNLYYDTGEKLYGTDTITITLSNTSTSGQNIIGCYSGTGDEARNFSLFLYGGGSSSNCYLRHGTILTRPRYGTGKRTLVISTTGTSGFTTDVTYSEETFTTGATCYIFALPNSTSNKFNGNIDGNILISDRLKYIPCERESDNVIGYYETHTNTFLEPQAGTPTSLGYDTSHLTEIYIDTETVEKVSVHSPNLLNPTDDNFVVGQIINESGSISSAQNNFYTSFYMPVKPSTSYVAVGRKTDNTISAYTRICWYNSSKTFISRGTYTLNTPTILTSPANAAFARIACAPNNSSAALTLAQIKEFNWIFQEGTTEPTYQPYVTPQTATATNLLGVGTYQDVQSVLDGAVTRKVGVYIMTGEETFGTSSAYGTALYIQAWSNTVGAVKGGLLSCSHFLGTLQPSGTGAENTCFTNTTGHLYFRTSDTAADFKQFLKDQLSAGTPVIIVYPLATATTESVTGQSLSIQQGTNIVEITQASIDDLPLEVSYKAGVEVTVEEVEEAQLSNDVEVTIS